MVSSVTKLHMWNKNACYTHILGVREELRNSHSRSGGAELILLLDRYFLAAALKAETSFAGGQGRGPFQPLMKTEISGLFFGPGQEGPVPHSPKRKRAELRTGVTCAFTHTCPGNGIIFSSTATSKF